MFVKLEPIEHEMCPCVTALSDPEAEIVDSTSNIPKARRLVNRHTRQPMSTVELTVDTESEVARLTKSGLSVLGKVYIQSPPDVLLRSYGAIGVNALDMWHPPVAVSLDVVNAVILIMIRNPATINLIA